MKKVLKWIKGLFANRLLFVIKRNAKNEWQFNIIAGNGECLAHSEGYKNKTDCYKAIILLKKKSRMAHIVER